jgi:hypothetical protein
VKRSARNFPSFDFEKRELRVSVSPDKIVRVPKDFDYELRRSEKKLPALTDGNPKAIVSFRFDDRDDRPVMAEPFRVLHGGSLRREKSDVERIPDFVRHGRFSP